MVQIILNSVLADVIRSEALDREIRSVAVKHLAILLPVVCVGAEGGLERDQIAKEHSLLRAELRAQQEVGLLGDGVGNVLGKCGFEGGYKGRQ